MSLDLLTLSAVSILIGIFHIGKFCFWVPLFKKLLLSNYVANFVEILNFGVTFLEHSVVSYYNDLHYM